MLFQHELDIHAQSLEDNVALYKALPEAVDDIIGPFLGHEIQVDAGGCLGRTRLMRASQLLN